MSKLAWGSAVASLLVLGCGALRLSVPSPLFASPYSTLLYAQDQTLLGARIAADGRVRACYDPDYKKAAELALNKTSVGDVLLVMGAGTVWQAADLISSCT